MTTTHSKNKKCAVCGKESEHTEWGSTNTLRYPDLDFRPSEMKRPTINIWIQTCPSCGYCSPDIGELISNATEVVHSDLYQCQLHDQEFPKLSNAFLCSSIIQENAKDYVSATWDCIHAAWSCDDQGLKNGARQCRMKAVRLLSIVREHDQCLGKKAGTDMAILTDLLRRAGQFESALKACNDGLLENPEKIITDILQYQQMLINILDTDCHTIGEAIKESASPVSP